MLDHSTVRELLDYEPETGVLKWKIRDRRWFLSDRACDSWNSKHADQAALAALDTAGYPHGTIFDEFYRAHVIIFFWMMARWPHPEVDHINRIKTDNRWINLRETSRVSNGRNLSLRVDNKSGHAGVWEMPNGSFCAFIKVDYQKQHLGCFKTFEAALAARKAAEQKHGFHEGGHA